MKKRGVISYVMSKKHFNLSFKNKLFIKRTVPTMQLFMLASPDSSKPGEVNMLCVLTEAGQLTNLCLLCGGEIGSEAWPNVVGLRE